MARLKPMSPPELDRLIEIKFYLILDNLEKQYGRSVAILDTIEALCDIYECNTTIVKVVSNHFRRIHSPYAPDKFELAVMLHKAGFSLRRIRKVTSIHPDTTTKYIKAYQHEGQMEFVPVLDEDQHEVISMFVRKTEKLGDLIKNIY